MKNLNFVNAALWIAVVIMMALAVQPAQSAPYSAGTILYGEKLESGLGVFVEVLDTDSVKVTFTTLGADINFDSDGNMYNLHSMSEVSESSILATTTIKVGQNITDLPNTTEKHSGSWTYSLTWVSSNQVALSFDYKKEDGKQGNISYGVADLSVFNQ